MRRQELGARLANDEGLCITKHCSSAGGFKVVLGNKRVRAAQMDCSSVGEGTFFGTRGRRLVTAAFALSGISCRMIPFCLTRFIEARDV
jgi:hypothetical protein